MITLPQLTQCYLDLSPKMYHWLTSNGCDSSAAQDLIHESFLRVWRRKEQVASHSLPALLWTILRHLRIDAFRRLRPTLTLSDPVTESLLEPYVPDTLTPLDRAYLRRQINRALQSLPPIYRTTFTLFTLQRLPIKVIARQTMASETLVKVRLHRARQKLRLALSANGIRCA